MKTLLFAILLSVVASTFVSGQDMPKNQTYFGYELQRAPFSYFGYTNPSRHNLNGLTFSDTLRGYKWLGIEGNASIGYRGFSGIGVQNIYFMSGPHVEYAFGRFAPYGHFLLGMDRLHIASMGSFNAFAIGGGCGASVYLTKHFGLSSGIDYFHASKYGIGFNSFRATGGPIFAWGGTSHITAHDKDAEYLRRLQQR